MLFTNSNLSVSRKIIKLIQSELIDSVTSELVVLVEYFKRAYHSTLVYLDYKSRSQAHALHS